MAVRITVYGGLGEIGGNKILLEADDTRVWLDFGLSYRRRGLYYQQFLSPRTYSGVTDLLRLGIVPEISGLYRDDPVGGVAGEESCPVTAVLLSHAHADHASHISLLRRDIPVAASPATLGLLAASEESGQSTFESEVLSGSYREPGVYRYQKFERPRLELAYGERTGIGSLQVTPYPVDHSVPGATAFVIESSSGTVCYTGDLRCHGRRHADTRALVDRLSEGGIDVLLVEGTNVATPVGPGEDEVCEAVSGILDEAVGRSAFCTFSLRDLDRLATFHELASAAGRQLVIPHRAAYLLGAVDVPGLPRPEDLLVYTPRRRWGQYEEREYDVWERPYLEAPNAVRAADIRRRAEELLVYLDFFSLGELIDLEPPAGAVMIHSQAEPFSEEMELDFERLHNWLRRFGIRYRHAHASGHIYGDELAAMVAGCGAERVIPLHTEHPGMFREFSSGVQLLEEGEPFSP